MQCGFCYTVRMISCSICGGKVAARGWCGLHYGRWQRTGDPNGLIYSRAAGRNCSVPDCDRPARSKGLCNMHYARWQKWGTTEYVGKPNEGATRHPLYQTWKNAQRKGCEPIWKDFQRFVTDVGLRPFRMAHFMRPDRTKPYGPSNFIWSKKAKPRDGTWKRERARRYAAKTPRQSRDRLLRFRFGIGIEKYDALFAKQNGVCAICGGTSLTGRNLAVDHCHFTGAVRGLLCGPCNTALGLFRDRPDLLLAAVSYLGAEHEEARPVGDLSTVRPKI